MVIVEKKVTFIVLTALVCLAEVVSENYRNTRPVGRFGFLSRLFGLDKYLSILGHNDFKKKSLKLENVKCISDLNGSGICTTTNYCLEQGGQVSGDCRRERSVIHGFKCCTFSATCGDEITHNGTIFVSPGFPKKFLEPEYCQTRVDVGYNICQLRIDFLHFTLAPPRSERPNSGKCLDDVFTVVADRGGSKIPSLCGDNSGQHVYVDVALSKQAVLNVQISPIHFSRKWAIQILQIPCGSPASAPFGCLQYFTGSSNVIKASTIARSQPVSIF
ncbi:uncharacterized protein LOC143238568 isoform X2 [Tachypleus tridentatus]|uniref:uncharacterized protein LOC143238568 isoform X2 n=1 Tax=Tachypleus tridentatus TaxID=6853 RepID=UPI003FD5D2A2